MAQTIDFYIDATNGQLVAAGSGTNGVLPTFTRNDVYTFRVRIQERDANGFLRDADLTGTSVKIGVGGVDSRPTEGQFKLVLNSVTSSAITYNSTAVCLASNIYTAVSNNVSTVNQFGTESDSFILTATGTNTAMSFGGDSFTLFPLSSVLVSTRRQQAANVQSQQIVKLRRNPAVFADTFTNSSTSGVISLSKLQDGSGSPTNKNEIYRLSIGPDAEGGGIVLAYGTNTTTAIPIGATAASFTEALTAVTGIGANNISVESGNNLGEYTISFVRALGNQNVTTELTLDASNVVFAKFLQSTVTFATAELDELFAEGGSATITPTLEIEITQSSQPKTIYQGGISVRKDLITTGSAIPAAQASYYTKAEVDAAFVEDLTTGAAGSIDAANRRLRDSGGTDSVSWESRKLFDGSIEYLRWDNGLGFFNNSAVSQPSGANAVSNVISLGLIASSATYGVLPQSLRTVTTLASVTFGTVGGNDQHYRDVVVTGAEVNDIVLVGLPSAVSSGIVIQGVAYKSNTVCLCANHTDTGSVDLNTATYRITVIGY